MAIHSQPGRWSLAAVAAAIAYPVAFRGTAPEWAAFLDELDAGIRAVERESSAKLRAAQSA